VAIVSGRDRKDVKKLVGLDDLIYAGSHGFDIAGPDLSMDHEEARGFLPVLDEAESELNVRLETVNGCLIERKRYSIAVHYRLVDEADVDRVEAVVDDVLAKHSTLAKGLGKKVFELRPGIDWDKGKAVFWLLEALGLRNEGVLPIYIGDDVTDEDAFRALAGRGVGVVVAESGRPTHADSTLNDTEEVGQFLQELNRLLMRRAS
jgi:alpha,alpha-trehalase